MADISSAQRLAQGVGITASGMTSGYLLSLSFAVIPTLTLVGPPGGTTTSGPGMRMSHIARQWRYACNIGKSIVLTIALTSSAAYTYLAYSFRGNSMNTATSNLYLLAAVVTASIIPYTLIVMRPVNGKLMARAWRADDEPESLDLQNEAHLKEAAKLFRTDAHMPHLLKRWKRLNIIRGLLPLIAIVFALMATL